MTDDRSSAGDPAATLRLLWRKALPSDGVARRGPPRALSVDAVVAAAVALADADGLTALTMRRLAERLGVKPMALYTYIPGRAELLDLMLDDVYASMPRHHDPVQAWQDRVRSVADDNRALFRLHPWAGRISTLRPPLGPGQVAKYEHELRAFTGSGLDDLQVDDALTHLLTFVRANARDDAEARATRKDTGEQDRQWWDKAGPLLARVVKEADYPLASRIGAASGAARGSAHAPQHAYTFGIDRILDSIERLTLHP